MSDPDHRSDPSRRTLSTGHAVELPLSLDARITGAVFSAPLAALQDLLPDGLEPLRLTPRHGGVTLLSVDYQRIGDDAMEPYDELSIQIPAVRSNEFTLPLLSGLTRMVDGYVWFMPVTTEPANALGREIWGYPKVVGDVDIEHGDARTRTTVTVDDEHLLTMSVARPPSVRTSLSGYSFTELDGALLREKTRVKGEIGAWPLTNGVSVELGDHSRAAQLAKLGLGGRAVSRLAADCEMTLHEGVAVDR